MNPRELRLGNYFHPTKNVRGIDMPTGTVAVIQTLQFIGVEWVRLDQIPAQVEFWPMSSYKEMSPVQLTEEWLLKFGWVWNEECKSYEKYPNGDVRLNLCKKMHSYTMFNYVLKATICDNIFYVHQLQNLCFSLTGEELTIKELVDTPPTP